jgi:hypothetical protein
MATGRVREADDGGSTEGASERTNYGLGSRKKKTAAVPRLGKAREKGK